MIVNAVEGDPHISCDVALLKEQGQSAVNAAKRTGQRLSAEKNLAGNNNTMRPSATRFGRNEN